MAPAPSASTAPAATDIEASASAKPDAAYTVAIRAIARDIAELKPAYPQLSEFDPERNLIADRLAITYQHNTHRSTARGGWAAAVPNPDPDGIWFYIDFHDPNSNDQIHTQPFTGNYGFRDMKVSFLILQGAKTKPFDGALWSILRKHGVVSLPWGTHKKALAK